MSNKTDDSQIVQISTPTDEEFDETVIWERDMKPLYDALVHMCEKLGLPSVLLIQFKAVAEENEKFNDVQAYCSVNQEENRPNDLVGAVAGLLNGKFKLYEPYVPEKDEVWINHPGSDALN